MDVSECLFHMCDHVKMLRRTFDLGPDMLFLMSRGL